MAECAAFDPAGAYVTGVARFVDCHAAALGADGYAALGPASGFGLALTGLLTIYVALIGYRLLLGGQITVREGMFATIRLGFVLALATQWAAYQPLVYDVITGGPAGLGARILAPGGLGGDAPGRLIARVQGVHDDLGAMIVQLAPASPAQPAAPVPGGAPAAATAAPAAPQAAPGADALPMLVSADRLLLGTALAGTLAVRVIDGLLLALGPVFIACLLFETTRGLFVGWLRVLTGAAFAALAAALVLSMELAVVEPQVTALRAALDQHQLLGALPQEMLVSCGAFAAIMLAALIAVARSTAAFRLPQGLVQQAARVLGPSAPEWRIAPAMATARSVVPVGSERSRAQHVADAARAAERRDARSGGAAPSSVAAIAPREPAARLQEAGPAVLRLGQAGRRTAGRTSAAAGKRDAALRETGR